MENNTNLVIVRRTELKYSQWFSDCVFLGQISAPMWKKFFPLRRLVQYGFSIQYWLVQYLSILYITLYNNLLVLKNEMKYKKYHTVTTVTKSNCKMVERGKIDTPNTYIHDDSFFRLCTGISIKSVGFNLVLCVQTSSLSEMMRSCKWYHTFFYVPKQEMCASQNMPVYINYQTV